MSNLDSPTAVTGRDTKLPLFPITHSAAGRHEMKKKLLKGSGWCDKNGLDESFKMSPHLICLSWLSNFHIISRPDPEAGHKRVLGCQPRPIKWGLISKLSMSLFSWHPPKSLRSFFHFDCLSCPVPNKRAVEKMPLKNKGVAPKNLYKSVGQDYGVNCLKLGDLENKYLSAKELIFIHK